MDSSTAARNDADSRPNILLILTDEERHRGWIPQGHELPGRQELLDTGVEFDRYYTHTSPCSPSRASLLTGDYLPNHGVRENVTYPGQPELQQHPPTLANHLSQQGYRCMYAGKWHLSHDGDADLRPFGFERLSDHNDRDLYGLAGSGTKWDPIIAEESARWLEGDAAADAPWFMVVSLINPHDVMWFPADQADFQRANPEVLSRLRANMPAWVKERFDDPFPAASTDYDEVFTDLPDNFDDDLFTKPTVQREWSYTRHWKAGHMPREDKRLWLRQLDYYLHLHRESDRAIQRLLGALRTANLQDSTAVFMTTDHGDMCGSHGLRSKGPFVYEEVVRIPLYARVPGVTEAGRRTAALATQVDLAQTILGLAGATARTAGVDLTPVLGQTATSVRDAVIFAQDMAWHTSVVPHRYALRGMFDGRFKYARYYGVGGGIAQDAPGQELTRKRFDVDAAFEDQDHELYDLSNDPGELENLANLRSQRSLLREWFERLRDLERSSFGPPT